MKKVKEIADPQKWQQKGDVHIFVVANHKSGGPAIEFRMDNLKGKYRIREWVYGSEDNLTGWFIGREGIKKISYHQTPPWFSSPERAVTAARDYYVNQYGLQYGGQQWRTPRSLK
jgi:hypothetical protein